MYLKFLSTDLLDLKFLSGHLLDLKLLSGDLLDFICSLIFGCSVALISVISSQVPGLLEKRPSVLVGDHLFLRHLKKDETPEDIQYKAYVHRTCLSEVHLGLSSK